MVLPDMLMGIIMGLAISTIVVGFLPLKAYEFVRNRKTIIKQYIADRLKNK
jgi:hypothetical protein